MVRDVIGTSAAVLFILSLLLHSLFMWRMTSHRKRGPTGSHPLVDLSPGNVMFLPRLLYPKGLRYRRWAIFWLAVMLLSVGVLLAYRATGPAKGFPERHPRRAL